MSQYDSMSVHELVEMLVIFLKDALDLGTEEDQIPLIESALRRKVIEEASVGVVTFTKEDENTVVAFKEVDLLEIGKKYSGRYHLIPEEVKP